MPAALRRRNVTRKTGLALLAAAGAWLACSTSYAPALVDSGAASSLEHALAQIGPLKQQVDAGRIIPKFGDKAQEIVTKACSTAGSAAPELEMAIDGALEGLFMRQAAILSKEVAQKFADSQAPIDAARAADQQFLQQAQELVRPGSGWSLEFERGQLRESITRGFRRDAAVAEERARAATTQQSTIAVISKLQEQMENLAMKVQSSRGGGSPWVLSSSYRIPNTPLQVVGRYEQGRANVELNLTPDKNPLNSDASFVEGIGPANIGVSFNLGI